MKIAVNTRLLLKDRLEGIGRFTSHIFEILSKQHPEVEWIFIFDRPFDQEFVFSSSIKTKVLFPPTRHPLLWHLWFQVSLPFYLRKEKVDLFISPDGMIPLWGNCPSISIIHDLNFDHQPRNLDPVAGGYMRHFYPRFARKAKRIGTVSLFCQGDISETYKVSKSKIDVIPNGFGKQLKPLGETIDQTSRQQFSGGQKYFLHLGALNPRKNLEGLFAGFDSYKAQGGKNSLLIVGEKMLWTSSIEAAYQACQFKEHIYFTGRLRDEALAKVLSAAEALCLVSHFEGFGIPILEAFASGTAVISADNTALPEVAADAALYINSRDPESIAQAMLKMENSDLQAKLKAAGEIQLKQFSWEKSAEAMWQSIQKSLTTHG